MSVSGSIGIKLIVKKLDIFFFVSLQATEKKNELPELSKPSDEHPTFPPSLLAIFFTI